MIPILKLTRQAAVVGRWIALVAGTLLTLTFLAFIFGEGPPPLWRLTLEQNLQFLGMCGLCAGLVLAWKWEDWGALVSLASWTLLLLIDRRFNIKLPIVLPASVALLHLLCWLRLKAVE